MAIQKIPYLSINGNGGQDQRPIFNGYIYSLNYDVKVGSEGSSTVLVTLISEDGEYNIKSSDLSTEKSYNIQVGKYLNLSMYLKTKKIMASPRGRLLELEFEDGSSILDRMFVGLHKKQGCNPIYSGSCPTIFGDNLNKSMIIVGREINPCDRDYDGKMDSIASMKDPCHPCNKDLSEDAELKVREVDCAEQAKYNILEVKYNFGDLITAITAKGFKVKSFFDPNPKCFADYTGSLRQVLSSWCADFGWIFFWEDSQIVFRDLRTIINVNANISDFCPNIEAREETETLDGTIQTNVITNYSRIGVNREFKCQDAVYVQVSPYTKSNAPGSKLKITNNVDESAASLSYYDNRLRSLWYWFSKYKMGDISKIFPGKTLKELGLTILTNPITLNGTVSNVSSGPLEIGSVQVSDGLRAGGIQPSTSLNAPSFTKSTNIYQDQDIDLDFMTVDLSDFPDLQAARDTIESAGNESFAKCFRLIPAEQQWKIARDIKNKYFFVGFWDQTEEEEFISLERKYASDFMGKYNIFLPNLNDSKQKEFFEDYHFIIEDNICATRRKIKQDNKLSYQCVGDENNAHVEYFNSNSISEDGDLQSVSKLPFSEFLSIFQDIGQAENSAQAIQDFKIVVVSKGNQHWFPTPVQIDPDAGEDIEPPKHNINNVKLINQAFSYYPIRFDAKHDDRGEDMVRVLLNDGSYRPLDRDSNRMFIFMGTKAIDTDFELSKSLSNHPVASLGVPFNGNPLNPNDSTDPTRKHEVIYQYPELKCLRLGNINTNAFRVTFKTPVGNFSFYEPTSSDYGVVIQKTRETTQRIQKLETLMYSGQNPNSQTLDTNVIYRNITDEDIRVLAKQPSNGACVFSKDKIKAVHDAFVKNLSYTQNVPLIKKVYTIAGLDVAKKPSISDGLLGLQISLGDDGVKSTYTFGTVKMIPPRREDAYTTTLQNTLNNGYRGDATVMLASKH